MARANREAFTLNELNPKEKVVFDFLQTQYNKSQVIKDILYEYIVGNDLQIMTQTLQKNHVTNTKKYIKDVSNVYKDLQKDNVKVDNDIIQVINNIDTSEQKNNNNNADFGIDLNSISDEEVNISDGEQSKSATENAMDFLLGM